MTFLVQSEISAKSSESDCGCADYIEAWWTVGDDGKPQLHINDDAIPDSCSCRTASEPDR